MNEIELARLTFKERINAREDIPREFKQALRAHERVPVFIDNLARELKKVPRLTKDNLIFAVNQMTDVFVSCVMKKRDIDMMTHAQRSLIQKQEFEKELFKAQTELLEQKGADHVFSDQGIEEAHEIVETSGKANQVQT